MKIWYLNFNSKKKFKKRYETLLYRSLKMRTNSEHKEFVRTEGATYINSF